MMRTGWRGFRRLSGRSQALTWFAVAVIAVAALVDEGATTAEPAVGPISAETEERPSSAEDRPTSASDQATATEAPPASERGWTVVHIVDGDTIDARSASGATERIRLVGIDTPERGECGFEAAAEALGGHIDGSRVDLVPGARDDRDRYGRLLRYVDLDGEDAGLRLIEQGLAIARYDSRDGYGRHPREDVYVAADRGTPLLCDTRVAPLVGQTGTSGGGPGTGPGGSWRNCAEARAAGADPVHRGDPGYGPHLDGDDDGIGCE